MTPNIHLHFILLVDDDPITNYINQKLFDKIADKVEVCHNGKEAIDYLVQLKKKHDPLPDLILLDTNMPVMDGFEFLHEYEDLHLSQFKNTKIVILTVSLRSDIKKIKSLGYKIVEKPLTIEKVHKILE